MTNINIFFVAYLTFINVLTSLIFIYDKKAAVKKNWRISEKVLWLLSLLGGAPFGFLTMITISHKTQKPAFKLLMPLLSLIEIIVCYSIIIK